jgi:hypothetical protein
MSDCELYRQLIRVITVAAAIIGFSGCGNDRPKTIPITGRVTINGQPPGERGKVHFAPISAAEGYNKRPATGAFTVEGTYRVMSWEPDDGLVPGRYGVGLMPGNPAKTAIPMKYQQSATSGLEVDVPVDQGSIEYNIDVVTK